MVSHSITCYPAANKPKSKLICEAFSAGSGVSVPSGGVPVFYGVDASNIAAWKKATEFYYIDNSYFDAVREKQFRVTKNAFQIVDSGVRDYKRLDAMKLTFKPWNERGRYIVVVEQSQPFMELVGYKGSWLSDTLSKIREHTDRPVRVRNWMRDKGKAASSLAAEFGHAWCLVTHMSAAANEALIAGVPVFVTGRCAAMPMASGPLSNIERPRRPDGVRDWAAGLAANQWTVGEMQNGSAWKALNA